MRLTPLTVFQRRHFNYCDILVCLHLRKSFQSLQMIKLLGVREKKKKLRFFDCNLDSLRCLSRYLNQTKPNIIQGLSHETNHSTLFNLVLVSVSCSVAGGHDVEIKCVRKSLLH
jgi:hypothetical protein